MTPTILKAFLQHLGWVLTRSPYASKEKMLAACAQLLATELGEPQLKVMSLCDEALSFWEVSGVVERVRFKVIETLTFVHKTFGEYAAASYLINRGLNERRELLKLAEPSSQWTEVLVFAASMGMGEELVEMALSHPDGDVADAKRMLHWARYSRNQLNVGVAQRLLQRAWSIISGPHSQEALQVGTDLVSCIDMLPTSAIPSIVNGQHEYWWTDLVGWSCLVHASPGTLNFVSLLAFMDSYAKKADTRSLSRGFVLGDPKRALWDGLLMAAVKEAGRRGVGREERPFMERLLPTLDSRSFEFVNAVKSAMGTAGIEVELPARPDHFAKYRDPKYWEERRGSELLLLNGICKDASESCKAVQSPLLHLSAFLYGTNFMELDFPVTQADSEKHTTTGLREVIGLAARTCAYDFDQLRAEAVAAIDAIKQGDMCISLNDDLLSVDAPVAWNGEIDITMAPIIAKALLHPSDWIVYLAANLGEYYLSAENAAAVVPDVLLKSDGLGVAAAAHLAIHFLGESSARELMIARLKQPLNAGSQKLYEYLVKVWASDCDDQIESMLKLSLYFGPHTAAASLKLIDVCSPACRQALVPLLQKAYAHWQARESESSDKSTTLPASPRVEIMSRLIEIDAIGVSDLYAAISDHQTEVSKAAIEALIAKINTSEDVKSDFIQRLRSGEGLSRVLSSCLERGVPFIEQQIKSIAELLLSEDVLLRNAASKILVLNYLPLDEIKKWARVLSGDSYQTLRDMGLKLLAVQSGTPPRK